MIWFTGLSQSGTGDWFFRDGTISFEEIFDLYKTHFKHRLLHIVSDCSFSGCWVLRAAATLDSMGIPPCGHYAREHGVVVKIWTSSQPESGAQELCMVRNTMKIDKDGYASICLCPHESGSVCSVFNSYSAYCPSKLSNCCTLPDFCAKLGWMGKVKCRPSFIYLVHGTDRGRPAWYYILLDEGIENAFTETLSSSTIINLTVYGKVLKSGFGEDPPDDVKKAIDSFVHP